MTKKQKAVNEMAKQVIKSMIEFCYENKIENPKITFTGNVEGGEIYKLVFERIDLDKQEPFLKNKQCT